MKRQTSWSDIFDNTTKAGRALISTSTFATTMTVVAAVAAAAIAVSIGLNIMNIVFIVSNVFVSLPSTAVATTPCANGYDGLLLNGALLCPVSSQIVSPGLLCGQGGVILFFENADGAFNATICSGTGSAGGNITLAGGHFTDVVQLPNGTFIVNFDGALSYNGTGFSLIRNASELVLSGVESGPGVIITDTGTDLVLSSDISFSTTGTGDIGLINTATTHSVVMKEIASAIPHLFLTDVLGSVVLNSDVICDDGRPSIVFNGTAYCDLTETLTPNAVSCNGATLYSLYSNGSLIKAVCASASIVLSSTVNATICSGNIISAVTPSGTQTWCSIGDPTYSPSNPSQWSPVPTTMSDALDQLRDDIDVANEAFLNSTSVLFSVSGKNVSANALLTLVDAQGTGASLIAGTTGNTGILKPIISNIPGVSILSNATSLTLSSSVICSDGRPSILFNGSATCNWSLGFGAATLATPGGTITFTSDLVNTSWPMAGPAPFSPANPSLWPANTTLVAQALNYLGIYRAQDGVCPSGGQAMITVNGVAICATRIDPGPAIAGCKNGVYNLDSGIATGTVCKPQVLDGAEITVDTLAANFSLACGGLNDVTDTLNCIWNNYIYPGLINQTSASTIVYTPPFPVNCQTSFSLSAMLTFVIVGQLPNNTFNVYVNPIIGDDTCGGGTFARPYATLAYAVTKIPPAPSNRLFNIILSVNTHTVTGDLYLPPNVQFTTTGNLRFTIVNVTGNIYLNSSWSLYANDKVLGGFSGITIYYSQMILDFRILGSYGPSSDARFQLYNTGIFGSGVYVYGRGSVDLFHVNDINANNAIRLNCATFHQEKATMASADTIITDDNCTSPTSQTFFHEYSINDYLGTSTLAIYQTTSSIHAEIHNNGFDDGSLILLGTIQDALVADVSGLPINRFTNSLVNFEIKASAAGIAMANLTSAYWGDTFLTVDAMFGVVQSYLKLLSFSGSGQSLLDSTTVTTNTLKGLRSISSGLTITPASGTLDFAVVPSAFITIYNTSDPRCDSAGGWVLVISGVPSNVTGCYGADTDTVVFSSVGSTNSIIAVNNATLLGFKGIGTGSNIQITDTGSDLLIDLVPNPSVTTLNADLGITIHNAAPICFYNGANTFSTCLYTSPSLTSNTKIFLPVDNGTAGELLVTDGAGHLYYEPLSAVINATTVTGDAFIQAAYTMVTNTYALTFIGTIYSTSSAIGVTKNSNGTFALSFTSPAITLIAGTANVAITPGVGTNNFTIAVSDDEIPIIFGGTGTSPFVANNATLISLKGFLAGSNMALTESNNNIVFNLIANPAVTSLTATSGVSTQGASPFCLFNAANTASTCLYPSSSLSSSIPIYLPADNGTANQMVVTDGAGHWSYQSLSAVINATSVTGDAFIQAAYTMATNTYALSFIGTIYSTSSAIAVTKNTNGTFGIAFTDPAITLLSGGANVVITPGIGSNNFTISVSSTAIPIVFGGTGASPFIANNASLISFKGLLAGLNMVVTSGGTENTVATTATPSFTTVAVTATSNQFSIGTTNLLTLNFAALASPYTLTVPDFGGAASLVGTVGTQTIGGSKTFNNQVAFSATSNQFLIGATNLLTVNFATLASPYTLTFPDFGGTASVVGTVGTQTIGGSKTFSSQVAFSTTSNQFSIGTTNLLTVNFAALASPYTLTFPDFGGAASVVGTLSAQTIGGVKTFSAKPVMSANVGVQFNNAGNTASVTVATQAGLASSITLNLPTTVGNNGDVLMGDGANNINFATPSVKTLYSSTAILTQTNPGAGTFVTMYPAGSVSLTIPATLLIAGSKIRFEIFGTVSTSAATTFSFRNRLDGTTVYGTSSSSTGVALSSIPFTCKGFLSIITAGVGGTAISSGTFFAFKSTTNAVAGFTSTVTTAIDTTTSHTFDTQFAFSALNAANVLVVIGATVQHVKPYA